MLPYSLTPWILHEEDAEHSHAIAKTPGRGLASRFVCRHDLLLCLTPL